MPVTTSSILKSRFTDLDRLGGFENCYRDSAPEGLARRQLSIEIVLGILRLREREPPAVRCFLGRISPEPSLDAEFVAFRVEQGNVPAVVAVEHCGERGSGVHAEFGVGKGQSAAVRLQLGTLGSLPRCRGSQRSPGMGKTRGSLPFGCNNYAMGLQPYPWQRRRREGCDGRCRATPRVKRGQRSERDARRAGRVRRAGPCQLWSARSGDGVEAE